MSLHEQHEYSYFVHPFSPFISHLSAVYVLHPSRLTDEISVRITSSIIKADADTGELSLETPGDEHARQGSPCWQRYSKSEPRQRSETPASAEDPCFSERPIVAHCPLWGSNDLIDSKPTKPQGPWTINNRSAPTQPSLRSTVRSTPYEVRRRRWS